MKGERVENLELQKCHYRLYTRTIFKDDCVIKIGSSMLNIEEINSSNEMR